MQQFKDNTDQVFGNYCILDASMEWHLQTLKFGQGQARLVTQLLQLIRQRLAQLDGIPKHDCSLEIAALKHAKRQLLLPSDGNTFIFADAGAVKIQVDELCSLDDYGTAFIVLQHHAKKLKWQDYIKRYNEIILALWDRIPRLPAALGVDIPQDVLDRPFFFEDGAWRKCTRSLQPSDFEIISARKDCTGSTILHNIVEAAARVGPSEHLESALTCVDFNHQDFLGQTALHIALGCTTYSSGRLSMYLISRGADPNLKTIFGHTALHYAASLGQLKLCAALLGKGVDVNARDAIKRTPLLYAVCHGQLSVVELLLDFHDTDRTIGPSSASCPLRAALELHHEGIAIAIMNRTDWIKHVYPGVSYWDGRTLLQLAVSCRSEAVVAMMLRELRDEGSNLKRELAIILSLAVRNKDLGMVQLILSHPGTDAGEIDEDGITPLHYAARDGSLEIATVLASRPDCRLSKRLRFAGSGEEKTAYEAAVESGNEGVAEMLRLLGHSTRLTS